jgi:hypothetical protein
MDPRKEKRTDDPRNSSNLIPSFSTERVDFDEGDGYGKSYRRGGRKHLKITKHFVRQSESQTLL